MLLEFPNPRDPQDAEVAKMVLEQPEQFARTAQQWAIQYAGAPQRDIDFGMFKKEESVPCKPPAVEYVLSCLPFSFPKLYLSICRVVGGRSVHWDGKAGNGISLVKERTEVNGENSYKGYNKDLVDRFVNMGFPVNEVVDAFLFVGIDRNGGEDYELEEAYMGDITARLLGEN